MLSSEEAEAYHAVQIGTFAATAADMIGAITMTYAEEAIGVTRAARAHGMPVSISFTVETDGLLPSGQSLGEAIAQVDRETAGGPDYYMINCAHPDHFEHVLEPAAPWLERIRGVRANASRQSHAELDEATELDAGNPQRARRRVPAAARPASRALRRRRLLRHRRAPHRRDRRGVAARRPRGRTMSAAAQQEATRVSLPGRVTLDVFEQGDPDGTPLVLLHGLSDSWHSWERLFPHFPASVRVIAVSQRGHGDSERPGSGYGTRDFAGDIAALLDSFGLADAVIAGHSMGSTVARRFAVDHPGRARGLALLGSFAGFADRPDLIEFGEAAAALTDPIPRDFMREFQESTLVQPIPEAFLQLVIDESCKVPASVFAQSLGGLIGDDVARDVARITAPAVILWGDQDAYCPRADQDVLLGALPGSRLSVFEGAGHAFHWEQPERAAKEIAAFAAGVL